MTDWPARQRFASSVMALAAVSVVSVAAVACVSEPVRTGAVTAGSSTAVLPASFCDPIRALSVDAWSDTGARPKVAADLAAARAKAPVGMQAALDTLIQLEQEGAGSATTSGTTSGSARSRWLAAMSTLADVAQRECNVDVAAGAKGTGSGSSAPATVGSTPRGTRATGGTTGGLTFDDVLDLVRVVGRGASWLDRPLHGTVAVGSEVQVEVEGVADAPTALQICADLLAVLPTRTDPPSVAVRDTTGFVIVSGNDGVCQDYARP